MGGVPPDAAALIPGFILVGLYMTWVAVVAVGAYNVGRISAAFDPVWSGNSKQPWVTNRPRPCDARSDGVDEP